MLPSRVMRHMALLVAPMVTLTHCSSSSTSAKPGPDSGTDASTTETQGSPPVEKVLLARTPVSIVPMSAQVDAIRANNAFSLALYNQLRGSAASQNLITSPLSANLALTMAYAGAQGTTASQMATALQLGSATSSVFAGQNALTQALASRAAAALAAARHESEGTASSEETMGNIQGLLPPNVLTDKTRMVLVNAIHLELPWETVFQASDAAPAAFTTMNGTSTATVMTPFMNLSNTFHYVDDGSAQIVWLPLGANAQLAVAVVLPHDDLATWEGSLTTSVLSVGATTPSAYVQLSLPKVSFSSASLSLVAPLQALGMKDAFVAGAANFSGMTLSDGGGNPGLYVDDVLQRADTSMAEKGVQASAATAVIVASGSASEAPPTPVVMNVNRPYFVSILDIPTGAILFMGHIVDPTMTGG